MLGETESQMIRCYLILMLVLEAGCIHEKRTPVLSAPPENHLTVDSLPGRASEAKAVERQYPSTGVETWDPAPTRRSALPQAEVPTITAAERERAISAARDYLFKGDSEPPNIEYNVRRTEDGYSVFVVFAHAPGGHCSLRLSRDWKVIELIRGA